MEQIGIAAAVGGAIFLACGVLIRRRMRRRGTGFFFYLEYVWLPLLILAGLAAAYLHVGQAALSQATLETLVALWLLSFLVIGLWALFLPLAYYTALPFVLVGAAILAGVTLGNLAGIGLELWQRRRKRQRRDS